MRFLSVLVWALLLMCSWSHASAWTYKDCPDAWQGKTYKKGDSVSVGSGVYVCQVDITWSSGQAVNDAYFWKFVGNRECGLTYTRPDSIVVSSSSQVSSSSSQNRERINGEPSSWTAEGKRTHICDISMKPQESNCIFPEQLSGSTFRVPKNVTRFGKSALRLCSVNEGAKPTAIVYALDRSGSMVSNDPNSIADDAFRKAAEIQYSIDSSSLAAYIPFSGEAHMNLSIGLDTLKGSHLAKFKGQQYINDNTALNPGGTNYLSAITEAARVLADPKLANHQKMIFFLTDGEPTVPTTPTREMLIKRMVQGIWRDGKMQGYAWVEGTDTLDIPTIHTLFLSDTTQADSLKVKSNRRLVDFMAYRSGELNGTYGAFHHIQKAEDIDPILRKLINTYVKSSIPTGLELKHLGTNEVIRVSQQDLTPDAQGNYQVTMNDNLNLKPGRNQLSLRATYTDIADTNTRYDFEVLTTDSIMNNNTQLSPSPFWTQCYLSTGIFAFNHKKQSVEFFQPADSNATLQFVQDVQTDGNPETLDLEVRSLKTQDFLRVQVKKTSQTPIDGQFIYEGPLRIQWDKSQDLSNAFLESQAYDSLSFVWTNPNDIAEQATGFQKILWTITELDSIVLRDTNINAKLDQIWIHFKTRPNSADRKRLQIAWDWPLKRGGRQNINWEKTGQIQVRDSNTWIWTLDEDSWLQYTGLPLDSLLQAKIQAKYESWRPVENYDRKILLDRMEPMVQKAFVSAVTDGSDRSDTLRILYTEAMDGLAVTEDKIYDFWTRGQIIESYDYGPKERWGASTHVLFMKNQDSGFWVQPGDSVKPRKKLGYATDLSGNTTPLAHPFVYIDGNRRQSVQVTALGVLDPQDPNLIQDSSLILRVFDGNVEVHKDMKAEGRVGLSWGPIKVARDETDPSKLLFPWKIWIYDTQGQYVQKSEGVVDCQSPELQDRCRSEEGIKVFFQWDMKSSEGRWVGTGAYPILGKLRDQDVQVILGVQRGSRP
jgi:hypothetical protein